MKEKKRPADKRAGKKPGAAGEFAGVYRSSRRGYGFVVPENAKSRDDEIMVFDENNLAGAIDGDRVAYTLYPSESSKLGVLAVVKKIDGHKNRQIIAPVEFENGIYSVTSNRKNGEMKIEIKPSDLNGAAPDDLAAVEILHEFTKRRSVKFLKAVKISGRKTETKPRVFGRVTAVLGNKYDILANYEAILTEFEIEFGFSEALINESERIKSEENRRLAKTAREDLRSIPVFTIDGESAKDLDDAVSLEMNADKNYVLGVHIADVSEYIKDSSPLDAEAYSRGTSVYFADRVAPMFPPAVSNGICSLTPNEDKLCLSAFITIDKKSGKTLGKRFAETVINSKVKGIYSEINALFSDFDGGEVDKNQIKALKNKYRGLIPTLKNMRRLSQILKTGRRRRGALELSTREPFFDITYDENGRPAINSVSAVTAGESENLIEEFMVKANEAAAELLEEKRLPCMFRIHEPPHSEKTEEFFNFIKHLGYSDLKKSDYFNPPPKALQKILDYYRGGPLFESVNVKLLRSLSKARYSGKNAGHYGLASECYCHFTSPIRRYPDLFNHRVIKSTLNPPAQKQMTKYEKQLAPYSEQCTEREINAVAAERRIADFLCAVYMKEHIGEEFEGVISGVAASGVFVELDNTCEGFVRSYMLADELYFDRDNLELRSDGDKSVVFRIGKRMKIRVKNVSIFASRVDFEPV